MVHHEPFFDEQQEQHDVTELPEEIPAPTALRPGPDGGFAVLKAIQAVKQGLTAVGKEDLNKHHKYNFRSTDAVINAVSPLFAEHGLVLIPNVIGRFNDADLQTFNIEYTLACAVDGSAITGCVIGQGQGRQPTAVGAAMSYALKYFVSQVFTIPFDDDRLELDHQDMTPTKAVDSGRSDDTPAHVKQIRSAIAGLPDDARAGCVAAFKERFDVEGAGDVPVKKAVEALKFIAGYASPQAVTNGASE